MSQEVEKVIEVKNVRKVYRMGKEKINAVDDVSFDILKGEFCCLLGTSGSGKSTLLNLMAGIEKLTNGQIIIKGKNIHKMGEKGLAKFRQRYLGFVFQSYNLMNSMTALENVEFPLIFKRMRSKQRKKLAKEMLMKVGLKSRLNHKPKEMSGGQQQRVGIARAFVAKPEIVFADEPTGNLDTKTTMEVMDLIKEIAHVNHQTIVMVTHDRRLANYADKIIHILDGKIQSIEIIRDITNLEEANEKNMISFPTDLDEDNMISFPTDIDEKNMISFPTDLDEDNMISLPTDIDEKNVIVVPTDIDEKNMIVVPTDIEKKSINENIGKERGENDEKNEAVNQ